MAEVWSVDTDLKSISCTVLVLLQGLVSGSNNIAGSDFAVMRTSGGTGPSNMEWLAMLQIMPKLGVGGSILRRVKEQAKADNNSRRNLTLGGTLHSCLP